MEQDATHVDKVVLAMTIAKAIATQISNLEQQVAQLESRVAQLESHGKNNSE